MSRGFFRRFRHCQQTGKEKAYLPHPRRKTATVKAERTLRQRAKFGAKVPERQLPETLREGFDRKRPRCRMTVDEG